MSKNTLRLSAQDYAEVLQSLKDGRKIAAIKCVRSATNCGLKEAKQAIDRLVDEKKGAIPGTTSSPHAMKIVSGPSILNVTLDYGGGPVSLDIEGMQLRALTDLQAIGIDECSHMLHLVDVFRAITEGKKVCISDTEDVDI